MKERSWRKGTFDAEMADLIGRVITEVERTDDELKLFCGDGVFTFYHDQNCCENVYIESIVGDLIDLIGEPILVAEEVSDETAQPVGWQPGKYDESYTWTFYKLATRKGYVDIRWFGESNGYYSESVDLKFEKKS